ncbi:MAG: antibiotic biosynthesis monooxygenase family protein [Acidimicrobiales bacterium]
MPSIADTPPPPYYAAIFTTVRTEHAEGYADAAARMFELAAQQPGFLGVEIVADGRRSIGISYWTDEAAMTNWRQNAEHLVIQQMGRERWYESYSLRIARVERCHAHPSL